PTNQPLLTLQNNLTMSMKEALEIETHNVGEIAKEKDALIQRIVRELDRADDLKEKEWERQRKVQHPIRTYLHQDLKQWMGRFLSRPGVEDLIDSAAHHHEGEDMEDIWHASTFCQFPGPDGKPFLSPSIREGRYVFSLGVDGFNPFQNKVAKQNVTVTGMYMVCLNLPPDLRYLPENMFLVGIIP
ncbi:hypothetical protein C8R48DRAFT_562500, partial [Suillus tomentosus]